MLTFEELAQRERVWAFASQAIFQAIANDVQFDGRQSRDAGPLWQGDTKMYFSSKGMRP
jgi:hypothetical protein